MKLLFSILLALALMLSAGMDVAHAVSHDGAVAESPHDGDHGEMSCCDSLSSRGAPCLGDVLAEMAGLSRPAPTMTGLSYPVVRDLFGRGITSGIPTGPPKA